MTTKLNSLIAEAESSIEQATDLTTLDQVRVAVLGKKGALTAILKTLENLPADQRRESGQAVNYAKQKLQQKLESRRQILESETLNQQLSQERVDVTLSGRSSHQGAIHPVARTLERIEELFRRIGFVLMSCTKTTSRF